MFGIVCLYVSSVLSQPILIKLNDTLAPHAYDGIGEVRLCKLCITYFKFYHLTYPT